jgi:hypothetical protein
MSKEDYSLISFVAEVMTLIQFLSVAKYNERESSQALACLAQRVQGNLITTSTGQPVNMYSLIATNLSCDPFT